MEYAKKISAAEFRNKFNSTGVSKSEIFHGRKALMEEIYATGAPIYCDQSYYAHYSEYYLVEKVEHHFECGSYKKFEDWRDCHYYYEHADEQGNKVWLMRGGRYD